MIDPHTGLIVGAVAAKGGVVTYHYDPAADRIVGCWLNAQPVAQLPDIVAEIRADVAEKDVRR